VVTAGGGGGEREGGGGGSGGAILLEAPSVITGGVVAANGGGGGSAGEAGANASGDDRAAAGGGAVHLSTGEGGAGEAGATVEGADGRPNPDFVNGDFSGGGGGGAGYIRINGESTVTGTLSPALGTPLRVHGRADRAIIIDERIERIGRLARGGVVAAPRGRGGVPPPKRRFLPAPHNTLPRKRRANARTVCWCDPCIDGQRSLAQGKDVQ
jgi:hypothetical protein